jgi:hypothetical protein
MEGTLANCFGCAAGANEAEASEAQLINEISLIISIDHRDSMLSTALFREAPADDCLSSKLGVERNSREGMTHERYIFAQERNAPRNHNLLE